MKLEIVLLALIATREMSGYDVNKWFDAEGKFTGFDRYSSQVYRYLNRMNAEGLLRHTIRSRHGVPDAKVYRLTDNGLAALREWLYSEYKPTRTFLMDPEFNFRIEVAAMLDIDRCLELLRIELATRLEQIGVNRGRNRRFDSSGRRPEVDIDSLILIMDEEHRVGTRRVDLHVEWVRELIGILEARRSLGSGVETVGAGS